ncbi:uncharacterized protein LOC125454251 isoform X2 [Stegostoma tigrinum]|uniref:uncharacterized protein LOC125454251 isoform X2 n=1 Tax=Stegostoma tigrinum TaxID=3053191 RepID=UPI002870B11D|nr:uncharacterized protein LOC125454251 isoform X2 [Stegostoma tigrinum]
MPERKADLQDLQTQAAPDEKKGWSRAGSKLKEGVWYGPNDKPCYQGHCSLITVQVKKALPQSARGKLHDLQPGDWIVVKDFRRKSWKAKRWLGPFQVLLVTQTAVKVAERVTWIHASDCKQVPEPSPVPEEMI